MDVKKKKVIMRRNSCSVLSSLCVEEGKHLSIGYLALKNTKLLNDGDFA